MMGRKPSLEKQAARYQATLERTRQVVTAELRRGDLTAAVRVLLGFAERIALESETAEKVYMLQFQRSLTYAEQDRVEAAFQKAVNDIMGEVGLWLKEKQ